MEREACWSVCEVFFFLFHYTYYMQLHQKLYIKKKRIWFLNSMGRVPFVLNS